MNLGSSNVGEYFWSEELSGKLKQFKDLLDSISELDDKTKILWTDIYQNAFQDRGLALEVFNNLWNIVKETPSDHAIHGDRLSKYIERMSKANDQLIKLADLVERAKEKSETVNEDEIFEEIQRGSG